MRHATLAALLLLASALTSFGADPKAAPADVFTVPEQKIEGASDQVPLGELVDLSVSPVTNPPPNLVETTYTWRVYDDGKVKRVRESNGGIFFGSGVKPKRLLVECAVTHLYLVKDADGKVTRAATRTVFLTANLQIGPPEPVPPTPPPTPPVPPTPPPDVPPSFPDGQYKLSAASWKSAARVADADGRSKGAAALAKGYRKTASDMASGKLATLVDALKAAKADNNQSLKDAGVDPAKWDDFGNDLQELVYVLYKDKKINTVADLGTAWLEIAAGLDKVK